MLLEINIARHFNNLFPLFIVYNQIHDTGLLDLLIDPYRMKLSLATIQYNYNVHD